MIQSEMFVGHDPYSLQEAVNDWLIEHKEEQIVNYTSSSHFNNQTNHNVFVVTIFYQKEV
jgi:hypothetical protein